MKRITVYCGSSIGSNSIYKEQAYRLGSLLAEHEIELVYGGSRVGLMGIVADGVLDAGGCVTGVLPHFLASKEPQHAGLTHTILVDTMHERKSKMYELGDGFIALPGGFGTMEELFEMLTWSQLSLHNKPIAILNVDGYYNDLIKFIERMVDGGFLKIAHRDLLIVSSSIEELLHKMKNYSLSK